LFTYDLPNAARASLTILDVSGRTVATIAEGDHGAGRYQLRWDARRDDGSALPAGLYFARFTTAGMTRTARLVLLP
jgi:flagellar hook assembly protein FlgD